MKRCPNCDAISTAFAKDHCDNPTCDWYKCLHCKAIYHRVQTTGFLNRGKTTWHSSTEA